jgi:hypothetical protein
MIKRRLIAISYAGLLPVASTVVIVAAAAAAATMHDVFTFRRRTQR